MEKNVWKIIPKNATGKSEKGYRGPLAQVVLAKDDETVNSKVETGSLWADIARFKISQRKQYFVLSPLKLGREINMPQLKFQTFRETH